ncbi:MAG TPA: hypothetical protein VK469_16955 [Candidatus Kapabacteria bacterium]|nr:hypothetical protein [Candidatus Kapabacteria bacterium]
MSNSAVNYRAMVLKELTKVPEEYIPFIFEQIRAYNESLKRKKIKKKSPTKRLMDLAGALENPDHLNAKQYKKKIVDEYLAQNR